MQQADAGATPNLHTTTHVTGQRPMFDGNEDRYEIWDVKFTTYLRIRNLHTVLEAESPDVANNALVFAELVQVLDDRSLSFLGGGSVCASEGLYEHVLV